MTTYIIRREEKLLDILAASSADDAISTYRAAHPRMRGEFTATENATDLTVGQTVERIVIAGYENPVLVTETVEVVEVDPFKIVALGIVRATDDPNGAGIGRRCGVFLTAVERDESTAHMRATFERMSTAAVAR